MIRNNPNPRQAMILTEDEDHRLLFRFQGRLWAWILGAMAVWLLTAAGFMWSTIGFQLYIGCFVLLGLALAVAALYSATTMRGMEIDKRRGSVRYAEKSLARNEVWEKPFSDFASISVHYTRAHSGRGRRPRDLAIEIVSREGRYYRIGLRAPGGRREASARELAGRIGDMMGLPVVASIGKN